MKKKISVIFCLFTIAMLFSTQNLTVNGSSAATATIGDELQIQFDFEEIGNSANVSFSVDVPIIEIPDIGLPDGTIMDGFGLDETPEDGSFTMTITASIQPPSGIPLIIIVEDGGVEAQATITFEPLQSTFSISGSIQQPGSWGFDMPVYPAIAMTLYNADLLDFESFSELEEFADILTFLDDHYLIMELNSFLGGYDVMVPDDLADVSCIVKPISLLDFEGTHVAPDVQTVIVNGAVTGIDFLYVEPDAFINGSVNNLTGETIENAIVVLTQGTDIINTAMLDETLVFSFPVVNGEYLVTLTGLGYAISTQEVTVDGDDVEVVLDMTLVPNADNDVEQLDNISISAYPNPFNTEVSLRVDGKDSSNAGFNIYNLKGQLVSHISNSKKSSDGSMTWNGCDEQGNSVSNGIYLIKTDNTHNTVTGKIMFLK